MKRVFFVILSMMPGAVAAQSFGYAATCRTNCPISAVLPYYTAGATISFTGSAADWSTWSGMSPGTGSGVTISNINQDDPGNAMITGFIAYMYKLAAMKSPQTYPGMPTFGDSNAIGNNTGAAITADQSLSYGLPSQTAPQSVLGAPTAAVPEPASWTMLIVGLGLIGFALRRRTADRVTPATASAGR